MLILYIFYSWIAKKNFLTGKCVLLGLLLFELGSAVNLVFQNNPLITTILSIVIWILFRRPVLQYPPILGGELFRHSCCNQFCAGIEVYSGVFCPHPHRVHRLQHKQSCPAYRWMLHMQGPAIPNMSYSFVYRLAHHPMVKAPVVPFTFPGLVQHLPCDFLVYLTAGRHSTQDTIFACLFQLYSFQLDSPAVYNLSASAWNRQRVDTNEKWKWTALDRILRQSSLLI